MGGARRAGLCIFREVGRGLLRMREECSVSKCEARCGKSYGGSVNCAGSNSCMIVAARRHSSRKVVIVVVVLGYDMFGIGGCMV